MEKTNQQNNFDCRYFYDNYLNKKNFSKKQLGISNHKGKEVMPFQLYKKIIITYFDIYFKDLYFSKLKSYFFLTGSLTVLISPPAFHKHLGRMKPESITLYWGERPNFLFNSMVKFSKLAGSTNRFPKLDKLFFNIFDRDKVRTAKDNKKSSKNKNIYF